VAYVGWGKKEETWQNSKAVKKFFLKVFGGFRCKLAGLEQVGKKYGGLHE
jgi:hypothetical protein